MGHFATIADWASILGLLVSVAGLCITIWVAFRVRRIERHYVRRALLPNYLQKLGAQIKNLQRKLRAKDSIQAIEILALCQSVLRDLLPHVSGARTARVSQVVTRIDALRKSSGDATFLDQCQDVNADLKALLDTLMSFQEELHWRIRNGE